MGIAGWSKKHLPTAAGIALSTLSIGLRILYLSRCAENMQRNALEAATGQHVAPGWASSIPWWTGDAAALLLLSALFTAGWALGVERRRLRIVPLTLALAALLLQYLMV